jgi:hypothetical protein
MKLGGRGLAGVWPALARSGGVVTISSLMSACFGFRPSVKSLDAMEPINGHRVQIGYFAPGGGTDGDYALLAKAGSTWQVRNLSAEAVSVEPGNELLYVRASADGTLAITPVFTAGSDIDPEAMLFICDEGGTNYTPCNSAFGIGSIAPHRRAIDREAVARAVKESGLVPQLEKDWAGRHNEFALYQYGAQARSNTSVHVSNVVNEPGLIWITPDDAHGVASVRSARVDADGKVHSVGVEFADYERALPFGTVRCSLRADKREYSMDPRSVTAESTVEVAVTVNSCDVLAPHPPFFAATDRSLELSAALRTFDPAGSSSIFLENPSSQFVTILSVSLYYFGKILTQPMHTEIPPKGSTTVALESRFSVNSVLSHVTAANAAQNTFNFGMAVKYSSGATGEKALLNQRDLSVKDLSPALPVR